MRGAGWSPEMPAECKERIQFLLPVSIRLPQRGSQGFRDSAPGGRRALQGSGVEKPERSLGVPLQLATSQSHNNFPPRFSSLLSPFGEGKDCPCSGEGRRGHLPGPWYTPGPADKDPLPMVEGRNHFPVVHRLGVAGMGVVPDLLCGPDKARKLRSE